MSACMDMYLDPGFLVPRDVAHCLGMRLVKVIQIS